VLTTRTNAAATEHTHKQVNQSVHHQTTNTTVC